MVMVQWRKDAQPEFYHWSLEDIIEAIPKIVREKNNPYWWGKKGFSTRGPLNLSYLVEVSDDADIIEFLNDPSSYHDEGMPNHLSSDLDRLVRKYDFIEVIYYTTEEDDACRLVDLAMNEKDAGTNMLKREWGPPNDYIVYIGYTATNRD